MFCLTEDWVAHSLLWVESDRQAPSSADSGVGIGWPTPAEIY
jgi:hypothetical protein